VTGGLSPRDRRTLAAGALTILLLVLLGRGLPAWRRWDAGVRASAVELAGEAARAELAARELPAMLDSLEARRARLVAVGSGVLEGGSPAASGAILAALVSGSAARAGVQIGSVQVRPDTAGAGTFIRVSVRADGTGDLGAITRMLVLLEGAPELLAVREASITQPAPGGPAEQPEALRLELSVEGLALAAPAAAPVRPFGERADGPPPDSAVAGGDEAGEDPLADGAPAGEGEP
jgi:Type II secretion system (T2SS), protein M subtype b